MRITQLEDTPHVHGRWLADWSHMANNYDDQAEVVRVHRPRLCFSMRDMLTEETYKQLAQRIDPNFLRQGIRARALRGVRYERFDDDTMVFWVTSSEIEWNGIEYLNLVRFTGWEDVGGNPDMTPREKAMMLLWSSDVQLYCNDPSFLFWGYQWILTQLDASIYPEPREPVIRNPHHRGIVCKHMNRVLKALPFYNGDMTKAVIDQWGGRLDKKAVDAIRRRYDAQVQANEGLNLPPEAEPQPPDIDMNRADLSPSVLDEPAADLPPEDEEDENL